jgi:hypothetical protein
MKFEGPMRCDLCGETPDVITALPDPGQGARFACAPACSFWRQKIEWEKAGDRTEEGNPVARIGGEHYVVHPYADPATPGLGSSGQLFTIRFADGRETVTNNLWHQGTIPAHLRELLPDNAEFADGSS